MYVDFTCLHIFVDTPGVARSHHVKGQLGGFNARTISPLTGVFHVFHCLQIPNMNLNRTPISCQCPQEREKTRG